GRVGKLFNAFGDLVKAYGKTAEGDSLKGLVTYRMLKFTYNDATYNVKNGTTYNYIGGVAGYATGLRSVAAEDCVVYAPRSTFVGGVCGRASAWDGNYTAISGTYNAMVKNTTVVGGEKVGGVMGEMYRYLAQNLIVDDKTTVEARKFGNLSKGTMVGGIAGYVKMASSIASEHPRYKNVISGATVIGKGNVGGIIGGYDQDFYTTESDTGWFALGRVIVNDSNINGSGIVLGRITGARYVKSVAVLDTAVLDKYTSKTARIGVNTEHENLSIDKTSFDAVGDTRYGASDIATSDKLDLTQKANVTPIGLDALKNDSTYTSLGWPTASDRTTSNYKDKTIEYYQLDTYLPSMTLGSSIQNSSTYGMKEMYPNNRMLIPLPGTAVGGGSAGNPTGGSVINLSAMPEARVYNSGVDTISVDFSCIDPSYTWAISMGEKVATGVVDRKTISFTYDYESDLTFVVAGNGGETVFSSSGADLANYVSAAGGEYYYNTIEGVARGSGSNALPTRYGNFANIFGGKALERDGSIIDLETGNVITAVERGTELLEERTPVPLAEGEFGGYKIEMFAGYSVATDLTTGEKQIREGFLLCTDGKTLQSIRTARDIKAGNVILWSNLENTYFAALGRDRKLTVLLDEAFRVPEGVSLEGISEMSNSRDIRTPYCIVRYANGGLCAFNFETGEILFEQAAPRGNAVGGGDATSNSNAFNFSRAVELSDALRSGAIDVSDIVRKSPISREGEAINMPSTEGDYVSGTIVSENEATGEITDGTEAVDGFGTETGDESVAGIGTDEIVAENSEDAVGRGSREGGTPGEKGEQPEEQGAGGGETDANSGAAPRGEYGDTIGTEEMAVTGGEQPEGNPNGNTVNGTNTTNGEGDIDGVINAPTEGEPNENVGDEKTENEDSGVDPKLLESVETEVTSMIEDGSLTVETITQVLSTTEEEAKTTLFNAAAHIAQDGDLSVREAIVEAFKDIVINPMEYIEEPEVAYSELSVMTAEEAAYARDLMVIKQSLSGDNKIDPSTLKFVPVFNPETGDYELFEMDELLTGDEEQLKSVEERLNESGKFINTSRGLMTDIAQSKDVRDYRGLVAVLIAIALAGGLTCALIYKKRKEGSR
nr:hypothetical protein [Lachnospiraceae bacterium]